MKILLTGATGFVGRQLAPLMETAGHELLLAGRDVQKLASIFPEVKHCRYDEIHEKAKNYDLLIHLAVLNNSGQDSLDQFRNVNVQLFQSVIAAAKAAGIERLLNVTTFHALEEKDESSYAQSKREALEIAEKTTGIAVVNLFLPAVHGNIYAGKLSILNRLPKGLRKIAFAFVSSLAPTVDVVRISDFVVERAMSTVPGEPVLLFDPKVENGIFRFTKRALDLLFSLAVLGLFWWGLLIVWIMVKVETVGGGIFSQDRIGRNGKLFRCYKFRTMKMGTAQAGTHEVSASSVTKIGAFLRKTKIDELPQIWNIFRGELSLVGPRPCLPIQVELIEARRNKGVLAITPGITGLAQINGIDMSDPDRLAKWDARYIARQSSLQDLKIIVATFCGAGQGDLVTKA